MNWFPLPTDASYKMALISHAVSEKKIFEKCVWTRDRPSFVEIGSPVPEKMFEGFLPYMGMAAILVM